MLQINKIFETSSMVVASAWAGSMWAIGYIAAPVVFKLIPDKILAGNVAGQMFAVTAYVGMVCAVWLLLWCRMKFRVSMFRQAIVWIIVVMLGLTLIGQFAIQPLLISLKQQALPMPVMQSEFAAQFGMWHGISSLMFLVASVLGAAMLHKMRKI